MNVYLSGTYSRPWLHNECISDFGDDYQPLILESYFYDKDKQNVALFSQHFKDYMLDSGAYTLRKTFGKEVPDYDEYVQRYAEYINVFKVKHYLELDIDNIVGYDNVVKLRDRVEALTGRQSIPVWHPSRGKENYIDMCKNYSYVAIGGIAGLSKSDELYVAYRKCFPWFIDIAHANGAKIHGLGYTDMIGLREYHFDSVDSTTWMHGNRCGFVYYFDGRTIQRRMADAGYRLGNSHDAAKHNYLEWLKFQRYAERNL